MKQENHGLCPFDDKRYLLADLTDRRPNPNTHAYGQSNLAAKENLVADQPEHGAELIIRYSEKRFARRHDRVTWRIELACEIQIEEELSDGDADGELNGDQLLMVERIAAARLGGSIRMNEVIKQIIARNNLEQPNSPPARMPAPPPPQRAGPTGLNAHLPPFLRRVASFNNKEPERAV